MVSLAIGIDFGSTKTVVACLNDERLEITQYKGNKKTPSYIYFDKGNIIVGEEAKKKWTTNPTYGVYGFKRLVGRHSNETDMKNILQHLTFKAVLNSDDNTIEISVGDNRKNYTIKELISIILKKVVENAGSSLSKQIHKVVLTVPSVFNAYQRMIISEAAEMANLSVIQLLDEQVAIALVYFHENSSDVGDSVLIIDIGGGSFNFAIIKKRECGNLDIVEKGGNSFLGGEDIDNIIMDYASEYLRDKYNFTKPMNIHQKKILKINSERVKHKLATLDNIELELNYFIPEEDCIKIPISRADLDQRITKSFQNIIDMINNTLKELNLIATAFKDIIVVGGCTNTPQVMQMLLDNFDNIKFFDFGDSSEYVAKGAALTAAAFSHRCEHCNNTSLLNIYLPEALHLNTSDFDFGEKIGKGTQGSVSKAIHKIEGLHYAIKQLDIDSKKSNKILRELYSLKQLNHPNVVRYYNSWKQMPDIQSNADSKTALYIQMELCNDNLFKHIVSNSKMKRDTKLQYFRQMAAGVHHIHQHKIIHRDLKPENIFLDTNGVLKIGDFGLAKHFTAGVQTADVGTFLYMSPERIDTMTYDYKDDIYAMGIIFYEIIKCYKTLTERISLIKTFKGNIQGKQYKERKYNEEVNLIKMMLRNDPAERIDTRQILIDVNKLIQRS